MQRRPLGAATRATHSGREPRKYHGIVNPPVFHASTVLFPSVAALEESHAHRFDRGHVHYGRYGTPTTFALEEAIAELEGGYGAVTVSSGLAAITTALTAFLKGGDHLLVPDSVYAPTRTFCDRVLARFGVETTYYDPLIGGDIGGLFRPATRVVFLESPGSHTFEVQDVPAIAAAARAAGIVTLMDNTWATPLYCQPLALGVDVSLHAATKYIVGHADAMLGLMVTREEHYRLLRECAWQFGQCAGPDDVYLGLRGVRSLPVRLRQHEAAGLELARWLAGRAEVRRVLHPALPEDPGHALWQRDFTGASGLFSVLLAPCSARALAAMLDGLELFGMGFSWGGFESLILPVHPERVRTAVPWREEGVLLRLHAGLEDTTDLIRDLERGFERLAANA